MSSIEEGERKGKEGQKMVKVASKDLERGRGEQEKTLRKNFQKK